MRFRKRKTSHKKVLRMRKGNVVINETNIKLNLHSVSFLGTGLDVFWRQFVPEA